MMSGLVSIIVPIYNVESTLNTCIKSILDQTYKEIELILVDDGSKDNSGKICDNYANKDFRVKVIHKKNEGVSIARNIGMLAAKGKYIQFVDSDDYIVESMTEKLVKSMDSEKILPVCDINRFYTNKNSLNFIGNSDKIDVCSTEQYLIKYLIEYKTSPFIGSPCNKLFIKDIIQKNGIEFQYGRTFAEDFLFNLEYLKYISEVKVLFSSLYYYRMDSLDSLTKEMKPAEYWWENYKYLYEIYKDLFIRFGLFKEYEKKISGFVEFAVRDTIRKTFRSKRNLPIYGKIVELKHVCQDDLTRKLLPNFQCKDSYMKTIKLFSSFKLYNLLGILLVSHSYFVDMYKRIKNNFLSLILWARRYNFPIIYK